MDYKEEILDNYQELAAKHPKAAAELLDKFGEGKWQEYTLCWYPNKEDFAKFEVEEGWYRDVDLSNVKLKQSYWTLLISRILKTLSTLSHSGKL